MYQLIFLLVVISSLVVVIKSHSFYILRSFTIFFLLFEYLGFGYLFAHNFVTESYGNLYAHNKELQIIFVVNSLVLTLSTLLIFAGSNTLPKRILFFSKENLRGVTPLKLLVLSVVVVYFAHLDLYNLPLFVKVRGGSIYDVAVARHSAGNTVAGFRWYKYFFRDLAFYILLVSLLRSNGFNRSNLLWLFFLLGASIVSGEKMPIIELLMFVFITKYSIIKGNKITVAMALVVLVFIQVMSQQLAFLIERLLVGQIIPGIYYIKYFANNDILLGLSIPNPAGIFPYTPVDLTVMIMDFSGYNDSLKDLGVKGTMPFAFWGELFANFGWLGVLLFIPLIFLLLFALDVYLSSRRSLFVIALHIYMAFLLKDLAVTGFSQFLFLWQIGLVLTSMIILKQKNAKKYIGDSQVCNVC